MLSRLQKNIVARRLRALAEELNDDNEELDEWVETDSRALEEIQSLSGNNSNLIAYISIIANVNHINSQKILPFAKMLSETTPIPEGAEWPKIMFFMLKSKASTNMSKADIDQMMKLMDSSSDFWELYKEKLFSTFCPEAEIGVFFHRDVPQDGLLPIVFRNMKDLFGWMIIVYGPDDSKKNLLESDFYKNEKTYQNKMLLLAQRYCGEEMSNVLSHELLEEALNELSSKTFTNLKNLLESDKTPNDVIEKICDFLKSNNKYINGIFYDGEHIRLDRLDHSFLEFVWDYLLKRNFIKSISHLIDAVSENKLREAYERYGGEGSTSRVRSKYTSRDIIHFKAVLEKKLGIKENEEKRKLEKMMLNFTPKALQLLKTMELILSDGNNGKTGTEIGRNLGLPKAPDFAISSWRNAGILQSTDHGYVVTPLAEKAYRLWKSQAQ